MSFLGLIPRNVLTRKVRSSLTALAVAIAIMMVVAMGVLTYSLKQTAISVLEIGKADFTVAQVGVADVLNSNLDEQEVAAVKAYPQVQETVGVLVAAVKFHGNPFFLELGIPPNELAPFGVQVLEGRPYSVEATDEIMLGARTAADLHKTIGDTVTIDTITFTVVGIYTVGNVFADDATMVPLLWLQGRQRLAGDVTLLFVKTKPGTDLAALQAQIQNDHPELACVQTASQFGLVDRNLGLISAADVGVSVLALFMGAVGVMNTTLMSVFERTREFGVLRAVGWSRGRILVMVMGEALLIALAGAFIGTGLGFAAVQVIRHLPSVVGFFHPQYPASVFGQALGVAVGVAFLGAIYPAARAALLKPMEALRHE
jgi:putative ABC transport system permease protein